MNVLFVYPEIQNRIPDYKGRYNEGVAAISAALKRRSHKVSLLHLTRILSNRDFFRKIACFEPGLVAFSCNSHSYPYVEHYARLVKDRFGLPIVCGGIHASLEPEAVIGKGLFDFVCVGEGEEAVADLACALSDSRPTEAIPNLWVKKGAHIVKNSPRPLLEGRDIPAPDRALFDFKNLVDSRENKADVLASRGCPLSCSYCCNQALKKVYPQAESLARFKDVDNLISEIEDVVGRYPFIKHISFEDDNLILDPAWFERFSREYALRVGLSYGCNIHPAFLDSHCAKMLKESGCKAACLGVESGDEFIQSNVLHRGMRFEALSRKIALLRENSIKVITYNMVGLPFEDTKAMLNTVKLNARLRVGKSRRAIFYPYPGTRLYDVCRREGLLSAKRFDTYLEGSVLNVARDKQADIMFFHRYFGILARIYGWLDEKPAFEKALDRILMLRLLPKWALVKIYDRAYSLAGFIYVNFIVRFYSRYRGQYGW